MNANTSVYIALAVVIVAGGIVALVNGSGYGAKTYLASSDTYQMPTKGGSGGGAISCSDTDGGINYKTYGICIDKTGRHNDECASSPYTPTQGNKVTEYYCNSRSLCTAIDYSCNGLGDNYICSNGACMVRLTEIVKLVDEDVAPLSDAYTCYDSDSGINMHTKGFVISTYGWHGNDTCNGTVELIEGYCDDDYGSKVSIFCRYGCRDSTCGHKPTSITTTTTIKSIPTTTIPPTSSPLFVKPGIQITD